MPRLGILIALAGIPLAGAVGAQTPADVVCPGAPPTPAQRLAIKTGPTGSAPYADLSVQGRTGPWLLDYGATASSVSHHGVFAPATHPAGAKLRLTGFNMPYMGSGPHNFRYYPRDFRLSGVGVQMGVVGTDVFKNVVGEFHFENARDPHVLFSRGPCASPPGFWRISQEGYFGTNPKLRASHIPNVPVVFIEFQAADDPVTGAAGALAGVRTFAQLDPGFDDLIWRYSVGVNEKLFARLDGLATKPVKVGEIPTYNCSGQAARQSVYVLPGWRLRIEDQLGGWMTRFESIYLVRYADEPAGTCNGIGTMPEPAAVLGASFLRAFGTTVILPEVRRTSSGHSVGEVWIRMPQQPPPLP